ncbi:sensor histidine kinase [Sphingomonas humi]|uniref:histidine kinase n=1 Tax=Sphingomonas humi TaxID=335630 RepID=A0ABP7RY14_9SPHN
MIDSQEELRQRVITRYGLGESDEEAFNQLSKTVATIFDVPIALLTVLRRDRQIFQGVCGLTTGGTDRESAFCGHTVRQSEAMVVEDALADPRFADNDLVTGAPFIRFYAGAPITISGVAIGSLCIIDTKPRTITPAQRQQLADLAVVASNLIETRLGTLVAEKRELELKRTAQLLRVMLDNVDQGIAYFDSDLKLALWNDRFFELHGFDDEMKRRGTDAAEMLEKSLRWGLFGPDADEAMLPAMLAAIRHTVRSETEISTREGRTLHSVRLRLDDGQGFIVAVRDLTAERISNRAKDEFISTISHELRTPLTAIRGAIALLGASLGTGINDRARQMLDMAQKNAARLSTLIDDILDIERLTRGQTGYILVPLQMSEVIGDAVQQNEPFAERLDVRLEAVSGEPLSLTGDPGRLLQVLTNLLSNATRHSPPGSVVEVAGMRRDHLIRVEVRDCGSGVPESFVDRLFDRFSQAVDANRRGHGGTGLGLAISRAIVEQHGGRIGYEPRASGGSCFWIELPAS